MYKSTPNPKSKTTHELNSPTPSPTDQILYRSTFSPLPTAHYICTPTTQPHPAPNPSPVYTAASSPPLTSVPASRLLGTTRCYAGPCFIHATTTYMCM